MLSIINILKDMRSMQGASVLTFVNILKDMRSIQGSSVLTIVNVLKDMRSMQVSSIDGEIVVMELQSQANILFIATNIMLMMSFREVRVLNTRRRDPDKASRKSGKKVEKSHYSLVMVKV